MVLSNALEFVQDSTFTSTVKNSRLVSEFAGAVTGLDDFVFEAALRGCTSAQLSDFPHSIANNFQVQTQFVIRSCILAENQFKDVELYITVILRSFASNCTIIHAAVNRRACRSHFATCATIRPREYRDAGPSTNITQLDGVPPGS